MIVILVYTAILLWAYATIISPYFSYFGYYLNWPSTTEMAVLICLVLVPTLLMPSRLIKPSQLVSWWMYVTVYIPSVLLPPLSLSLNTAKLMRLELSLLVAMSALAVMSRLRAIPFRPLKIRPRVFWIALAVFWIATLAFVASHFNLSTLIVNLASLFLGGSEYTIRNGFFDELSQAGRLLGYATGQIGEAVDPFLIAYGLVARRKLPLAAGIAGQLILFSVIGAKSVLFSTLFIAIVFFLLRWFRNSFSLALGGVLISVVLLSAGADYLSNGIFLSSITTRRTLLDPGLLTGFYYEHYSENEQAGLAYHFANPGESVPAPSYEIGLVYFGDEHVDANANLWAEGYADFGLAGIAGFTLLLGAMVWFYDSVSLRQNRILAIVVFAMQAFSFSNSAPLTTLITHGGLMSALLLWAAPPLIEEPATPPALMPAESLPSRNLRLRAAIASRIALRQARLAQAATN